MRNSIKVIMLSAVAGGIALSLGTGCDGVKVVAGASGETAKDWLAEYSSLEFKIKLLIELHNNDKAELASIKASTGGNAGTISGLEAKVKRLKDDIAAGEAILAMEKAFLETRAETMEKHGVIYPRKDVESNARRRMDRLKATWELLNQTIASLEQQRNSQSFLAEKIKKAEQDLALRAIEIEKFQAQLAMAKSAKSLDKIKPEPEDFKNSLSTDIAIKTNEELRNLTLQITAQSTSQGKDDYAPPTVDQSDTLNELNNYFKQTQKAKEP